MEIGEGKCLENMLEEHWATFLEEELQLRAYFERKGYTRLTTNVASGSWPNLIDPTSLQNDVERWTIESAELGDPPQALLDKGND